MTQNMTLITKTSVPSLRLYLNNSSFLQEHYSIDLRVFSHRNVHVLSTLCAKDL